MASVLMVAAMHAQRACGVTNEPVEQVGQVVAPFPKRFDSEMDGIEPIEQVAAEVACLDGPQETAAADGNQTHIGGAECCPRWPP